MVTGWAGAVLSQRAGDSRVGSAGPGIRVPSERRAAALPRPRIHFRFPPPIVRRESRWTVFLFHQRAADARVNAPYEYYYAREHIHKAREEAGYADYQVAIEYGRTAEEYATKARDISRNRRRELGR